MSGAVFTLRAGAATARIAPALGGRVLDATLEGATGPRAVLKPYPEAHVDVTDDWGKGGIYPLVPYNGRLRDAVITQAGQRWPLVPHAGSPHTLHGASQRRSWTLLSHEADALVMQQCHAPDAHWPWAFEATQLVRLTPHELAIEVTLRNTDARPAPGGIGLHPYLALGAKPRLQYEASAPWPFDRDYLTEPVGPTVASTVTHTFEAATLLGGEVTRFHAHWAGQALLTEGVQPDEPALQLLADGDLQALVLHRPAGAGHVCIEPVSHLPDAFNQPMPVASMLGARVLAPGESLCGAMVLRLVNPPTRAGSRSSPVPAA